LGFVIATGLLLLSFVLPVFRRARNSPAFAGAAEEG